MALVSPSFISACPSQFSFPLAPDLTNPDYLDIACLFLYILYSQIWLACSWLSHLCSLPAVSFWMNPFHLPPGPMLRELTGWILAASPLQWDLLSPKTTCLSFPSFCSFFFFAKCKYLQGFLYCKWCESPPWPFPSKISNIFYLKLSDADFSFVFTTEIAIGKEFFFLQKRNHSEYTCA